MSHLQQLPYHRGFQQSADTSRGNDIGVGHEDELVQSREKSFMLERLLDERIDGLLKGQVDANSDTIGHSSLITFGRASVGGFH